MQWIFSDFIILFYSVCFWTTHLLLFPSAWLYWAPYGLPVVPPSFTSCVPLRMHFLESLSLSRFSDILGCNIFPDNFHSLQSLSFWKWFYWNSATSRLLELMYGFIKNMGIFWTHLWCFLVFIWKTISIWSVRWVNEKLQVLCQQAQDFGFAEYFLGAVTRSQEDIRVWASTVTTLRWARFRREKKIVLSHFLWGYLIKVVVLYSLKNSLW